MHKITIKFYRTSRNAKKLEKIAEGFTFFLLPKELEESCAVTINKDCYPEDLQLFQYFWGIVKKYKDTAMYSGDRMLTKEQVQGVLNWMQCYSNKVYFPDETDYCCISPGVKSTHGWGCKWLHSVLRHGRYGRHNGVPWHNIGPFEDGIQYIDKQDIKDKLCAEAGDKCLQLCPVFSLEKAYQYIEQLPDQIDPEINDGWEYDVSKEPESKGKKIGVMVKNLSVFDLME